STYLSTTLALCPYLSIHTSLSSVLPLSCFSASVLRPYLPSFPTRRSSDLPGLLPLGGDDGGWADRRALAQGRGTLRVPARDADQDRKSTRLNSSHGSISYAVFCLKKKKK